MSTVTLSIIVPVYNKGPYLEQCVASILEQSFADFELILVDDGSTDNSGIMCDQLGLADHRVKVVHQHNQGVSAARNAGLALAQADYIGFVDADDLIEQRMYETLLHNALRNGAEVSTCQTQKNLGEAALTPRQTPEHQIAVLTYPDSIVSLLSEEISGSVCDKIYKRAALQHIRFRGSIYEDVYFNFQVLHKGGTVVFDNTPLYNYLVRTNSVSVSKFDERYMQVFNVAQSISQQIQATVPGLKSYALRYQFVLDMFLLNLILLTTRKAYQNHYQTIIDDLQRIYQNKGLRKFIKQKHLAAYRLFRLSPRLYSATLNLYTALQSSEMSLRT
jgi:glycosyltransferase involved in cell wall biosynthesis